MTDCERIVQHLREHGSITPLEAITGFGCLRLGARIFDLRGRGYDISTTIVHGTDMHGEPMSYARYELKGEPS